MEFIKRSEATDGSHCLNYSEFFQILTSFGEAIGFDVELLFW